MLGTGHARRFLACTLVIGLVAGHGRAQMPGGLLGVRSDVPDDGAASRERAAIHCTSSLTGAHPDPLAPLGLALCVWRSTDGRLKTRARLFERRTGALRRLQRTVWGVTLPSAASGAAASVSLPQHEEALPEDAFPLAVTVSASMAREPLILQALGHELARFDLSQVGPSRVALAVSIPGRPRILDSGRPVDDALVPAPPVEPDGEDVGHAPVR